MDPFEEFEFKPLTEGLGFHKKKTPATKSMDLDSAFEVTKPGKSLNQTGLSLLEEEDIDPLRSPLPRKSASPLPEIEPEATSTSTAVDEILKTLQKNRRLDFDTKATAKAAVETAPKKEEYKEDTWNFYSAFLDTMLVMAASMLCMLILLTITRVDIIANLKNPDDGGAVYIATFGLVATVAFIYFLVNRMFAGSTPGEWAYEQRMGKPEEMNDYQYPLRVAARSLLVIVTGFIVLPIISFIMKRDIAGEITGAKLYKKV